MEEELWEYEKMCSENICGSAYSEPFVVNSVLCTWKPIMSRNDYCYTLGNNFEEYTDVLQDFEARLMLTYPIYFVGEFCKYIEFCYYLFELIKVYFCGAIETNHKKTFAIALKTL